MSKHKVLIFKTGYSEFLDQGDNSRKVSLGDILRTTPLLHLYRDKGKNHVTWVTDPTAFPLLEGNIYIDRLLPLDFTTGVQLLGEEFDALINLEKNHDICKFSGRIDAWKKYGFRFDKNSQRAEAYDRASEVLAVSADSLIKKQNEQTVQELLFRMVGEEWKGEEYVLGYQPRNSEKYDIGLNTLIGQKWPTKAWPEKNWNELEEALLKNNLSITRQDKQPEEILKNLNSYMEWINSCRMIVTNDSLGLHLGIALQKKVLGIFGPTPHKEVYFYGRGKAILPKKEFECMPCFKGTCENECHCVEQISPEQVYGEIIKISGEK